MSIGTVARAVRVRWRDDDSAISGTPGPYLDKAPAGLAMPHVIMRITGSPVDGRANSGSGTTRRERTALEFEIWSDDGANALDVLARKLHTTFDNAPLVLDEGNLLYCRFENEFTAKDAKWRNVRVHTIAYEVFRSTTETTNPE